MWNMPESFRRTLREEHQYATMVQMLDTEFEEVEGGTIFSANMTNEITNFISDGNIDVDYSRGTRRTAELTLLNPTAEFTPALEDFDPEGPWVGKIYINRVVRIFRGLYIVGTPYYVPVGTFMIDNAEVIVERNMSLVVLTLSDLWKKLAKSYTKNVINHPVGTPYTLIVRNLLENSGADQPLAPLIDQLDGREAEDKKIGKKLSIEEGTSRGEILKELATKWDVDAYFDPNGRFILQDRKRASDKAVVWHFYSSIDKSGMLTNIRRSFNDDNLFNHVIIVGEENRRRERVDEDPRSKFRTELIGDRVYLLQDENLNTPEKMDKALASAWDKVYQMSELVQCETICNPALEADDVIKITELERAKIDNSYRLMRFNVPLVSSRQTIQCTNIFNVKEV